MKFSLLIYESEDDFAARTDPDRMGPYWGAYQAYSKALADAGIFAGGAGLQGPDSGTTFRLRGGKRQVQDGPHADTKEQLGGFYIIDVPDLEAALEWAARVPSAASGSVEVRPHIVM